jgi:hypothetical protein
MGATETVRPRVSYTDAERAPEDGRRYELYDGEVCVVDPVRACIEVHRLEAGDYVRLQVACARVESSRRWCTERRPELRRGPRPREIRHRDTEAQRLSLVMRSLVSAARGPQARVRREPGADESGS